MLHHAALVAAGVWDLCGWLSTLSTVVLLQGQEAASAVAAAVKTVQGQRQGAEAEARQAQSACSWLAGDRYLPSRHCLPSTAGLAWLQGPDYTAARAWTAWSVACRIPCQMLEHMTRTSAEVVHIAGVLGELHLDSPADPAAGQHRQRQAALLNFTLQAVPRLREQLQVGASPWHA